MSAGTAALVESFKVGPRVCALTAQRPRIGAVTSLVFEWFPTIPRRLSRQEWRAYRKKRDRAIARLAAELGGPALVVELGA